MKHEAIVGSFMVVVACTLLAAGLWYLTMPEVEVVNPLPTIKVKGDCSVCGPSCTCKNCDCDKPYVFELYVADATGMKNSDATKYGSYSTLDSAINHFKDLKLDREASIYRLSLDAPQLEKVKVWENGKNMASKPLNK